jgi:hypothetical protein
MEVLIEILPELVAVALAAAVAFARTTDTKIDDKVAKLAKRNSSRVTEALKDLLDAEEEEKQADAKARRLDEKDRRRNGDVDD